MACFNFIYCLTLLVKVVAEMNMIMSDYVGFVVILTTLFLGVADSESGDSLSLK